MAAMSTAMDIRDNGAAAAAGRNVVSGLLLGVGVAAFVDETVFHQLLHWHHFYDKSTPAVGLVSDGVFHAAGFCRTARGGVRGRWSLWYSSPPTAFSPSTCTRTRRPAFRRAGPRRQRGHVLRRRSRGSGSTRRLLPAVVHGRGASPA
jgi:hypothetical protein